MKKSSVLSSPTPRSERMNPLLKPFDTPLESVPFGQFDLADIREAIVEGIRQEDKEINRITANKEDPTFSNTLLAMQQTGEILDRALSIVGCLLGNASTPQLESLVQEMTPMISEHEANIDFNKDLFDRIKTIYTQSAAAPAEQRLQKEENEAVRQLLQADHDFLDEIQLEMSSARRFMFAVRFRREKHEQIFGIISQVQKNISEHGFSIKRMDKVENKRMLALYFGASIMGDEIPDIEGENYIKEADNDEEKE